MSSSSNYDGSGTEPAPSPEISENRLSPALLDAFPDAIPAVNQNGIILQLNSQTEALFGYTRGELIGQRIEILVPDQQRKAHEHHRVLFAGSPKARQMGAGLDLCGRRRDGSEFPVEISLSPVATDTGLVVLRAVRDVSDRKRLEKELLRAHDELGRRKDRQLWEYQTRLALIVDSSPDAIIGKTVDGIITSWNKGAERIYGYTAEEVVGRSIAVLAPPDRQEEVQRVLADIRNGQQLEQVETIRVRKDGQLLNVSLSVWPVRDANGTIIGASTIARDVTAQKRSEDHLRQAQKMEAIGRLAGGVAHDFNNLLSIISACAELLRPHVSGELPLELVGHVRDASKRGSSLTHQLLAFSRKQPAQARVVDLNAGLQGISKLLRPLLGDDVRVVLTPRSQVAMVEADPGHLDQLVLNLAVNSRDAMPHGGKFVIETDTVEFDEAFAREHPPVTPGRYVMLAVSDNGIGMDASIRTRIFEPFFTTKDVGKGTGLGLATVYGIVHQNRGHIWVYSELGHGTSFKIYLPCAAEKAGFVNEADEEHVPAKVEGVTVLLVEDDPLLRRLTKHMLEDQGYTVIEAENGSAALEKSASHKGSLDLVLTDVVMPVVSGPQLILQLVESRPESKFLYMSGYTGELVTEQGADSNIALLEKPFTRASLLRAVQRALQG